MKMIMRVCGQEQAVILSSFFKQFNLRHECSGFSTRYRKTDKGWDSSRKIVANRERKTYPEIQNALETEKSQDHISTSQRKTNTYHLSASLSSTQNEHWNDANPLPRSRPIETKNERGENVANIPNLLTWEEKTKIRTLHREQPEDWTIERLVGSYPASRSTIKKIVKSSWEPKSVEKHDMAVQQHWQQVIQAEVPLEPEMDAHLRSFPRFRQPDLATPESEKALTVQKEKKEGCQKPQRQPDQLVHRKYQTGSKAMAMEYEKASKVATYPDRIRIPRTKWKEGATYKIGDVYYDFDGRFLYRVPGMV